MRGTEGFVTSRAAPREVAPAVFQQERRELLFLLRWDFRAILAFWNKTVGMPRIAAGPYGDKLVKDILRAGRRNKLESDCRSFFLRKIDGRNSHRFRCVHAHPVDRVLSGGEDIRDQIEIRIRRGSLHHARLYPAGGCVAVFLSPIQCKRECDGQGMIDRFYPQTDGAQVCVVMADKPLPGKCRLRPFLCFKNQFPVHDPLPHVEGTPVTTDLRLWKAKGFTPHGDLNLQPVDRVDHGVHEGGEGFPLPWISLLLLGIDAADVTPWESLLPGIPFLKGSPSAHILVAQRKNRLRQLIVFRPEVFLRHMPRFDRGQAVLRHFIVCIVHLRCSFLGW